MPAPYVPQIALYRQWLADRRGLKFSSFEEMRQWSVRELDAWLQRRLDAAGDEFLPGMEYIRRWGYPVDETGTVPYTW